MPALFLIRSPWCCLSARFSNAMVSHDQLFFHLYMFSFIVMYYKHTWSLKTVGFSVSKLFPKFILRSLLTPLLCMLFPYFPTAHTLHHVLLFPPHFFLHRGFSSFWLDLKDDACQEVGLLLQLPIPISNEGAWFFYFWPCSIWESG